MMDLLEPRGLDAPVAQPVSPSWKSIVTSAPARWRRNSLQIRLLAALGIVAIAVLVRIAIVGFDVTGLTYLTFYPAVALAGLFGGASAGGLAALLCALLACVWIDPPNERLDWVGLGLFLGGSTLIVGSAELLGRAHAQSKVAHTLDNITNAVFAVDRNFIVTFVNRTSERIAGCEREELLGRSVWECLPAAVGTGFQRRCEQVMATGQTITCEEYNAPMGRWFDVNICRSDGGIAVYFHDITERKLALSALRESEERLRLALQSGKIGTWEWNARTNVTTWDARACELYGYPPGTIANREMFLERVHRDDRALVKAAIERAFGEGGEYECVYRIVLSDGVRWIASRGAVSVDSEGQPLRVIGVNYDVTDSTRRERNLAFSAALQRTFNADATVEQTVKQASAMIALHLDLAHCAFICVHSDDQSCTVLHDHNADGAPKLTGDHRLSDYLAEAELTLMIEGRTLVVDDIHQGSRNRGQALRLQRLGIGSFINAMYVPEGISKFMLHAARPAPNAWARADVDLLIELAGKVCLWLERAKSQSALAESEQRLDLALTGAGLGVWDWNVAAHTVQFDARWGDMIGYAHDEIVQTFAFWEDRVHPDDLPGIMAKIDEHVRGQTDSFAAEHRLRHKNGDWVWILSCGRAFSRDISGSAIRAIGVHININEQKRAEIALREREELLRAATNHASAGLVSLDLQRRYKFVNPAYAEVFGLDHSTLTGRPVRDVLPDEAWQELCGPLERAFCGEHVVCEFRRPMSCDGEPMRRTFSVVNEPERDAAGKVTGVVIVIFDITERKRAEERQALLIRELDHRVKNVLARMSVVIAQSREGALSIEGFSNAIEGRIYSMAKTHSRLSRNQWDGVRLSALVGDELEPYRTPHNTSLSGANVELGPEAAQVVSMVLHELATNAAKYGALSVSGGHVAVRWREETRDSEPVLVLSWHESGVGSVPTPTRASYGTEVIRELVRYELGGTVQLVFGSDGLEAEFVMPSRRAIVRRA